MSAAFQRGFLDSLVAKGFCITPSEYTHWVLTPFRHISGLNRVILHHSGSFPKGVILGCNTKTLRLFDARVLEAYIRAIKPSFWDQGLVPFQFSEGSEAWMSGQQPQLLFECFVREKAGIILR